MTKDWLVSFIAEKARISPQRAELAYDAFWEAILSELKTGHFTLPYGTGSIQLKEKFAGTLKDALKEVATKKTPAAKQASPKQAATKKAVAKAGRGAKKPEKAKPQSKTKSKPAKKKK